MALREPYQRRDPARRRPNILIIMSDQHRHDRMGCAGWNLVTTPHLDRLATQSIRFTNAYCSSPVSLPSRMSFLTGEFPGSLGTTGNYDLLDHRQKTLAHHFSQRGYRTALIGKMHFRDAGKHGFDDYLSINDWLAYLGPQAREYAAEIAGNPLNEKFFRTVSDGGSGFPDVDDLWEGNNPWVGQVQQRGLNQMVSSLDAEDTLDMFVARQSLRFARQAGDQPFLLIAGFMRPHPPMFPPPPWDQMVPVDRLQLPDVGPIDAYPACVRRQIEAWQRIGVDRLKADRSGYYGNLAFLDHCVGHLLAGFAQLGLLERTLVIYCSDHGDMDGDHGMIHKAVMFDPAAKVPLLIRYPDGAGAGTTSDRLISLMDLYPTVADYAGIPVTDAIAGRSLAGPPRDTVAAELGDLRRGGHAMIRDATCKLIWHEGDEAELYDLTADPDERENLAARPDTSVIVASLQQRFADAGLPLKGLHS